MFSFGEVIARKSLGASGLSVTFLTMTWPLAGFTSIWWARILVGRDQRRFLLLFGIIAYLIIMSGGMLRSFEHLFLMHLLFFFATAMFIPAENRILQRYIPSNGIGRLFGTASGLRTGMTALAAGGAGWYMDHITGGFRHLYLAAGLVGFIAVWQLASIRFDRKEGDIYQSINRTLLLDPLRNVIRLLKERKDFLRFEIAFMIYGIAFMMTLPVIPLYLVDDLQLSYSTIGMARGAVSQLLMIVAIPLFGRYFDRSTPHRMAAVVFLGLAFFPVLLLTAGHLEGTYRMIMVYVTFGYFGIVMSGVSVLWSLSSLRFAGSEDAGVYHSVHIAATSLRGMFFPLIGYFIMTTMGKTTALLTSSACWIIASVVMILMRRWDIRKGENRSLRV